MDDFSAFLMLLNLSFNPCFINNFNDITIIRQILKEKKNLNKTLLLLLTNMLYKKLLTISELIWPADA